MKYVHADPAEALHIFDDVHARFMIPIHHLYIRSGIGFLADLCTGTIDEARGSKTWREPGAHLEGRRAANNNSLNTSPSRSGVVLFIDDDSSLLKK